MRVSCLDYTHMAEGDTHANTLDRQPLARVLAQRTVCRTVVIPDRSPGARQQVQRRVGMGRRVWGRGDDALDGHGREACCADAVLEVERVGLDALEVVPLPVVRGD